MFDCNICGSLFQTKTNMYRHKRIICLPKQEKHNEINCMHKLTLKIKELELKNSELEKKYIELEKEHAIALTKIDFFGKTIDELTPLKNDYLAMLKLSHESTTKVMSLNSETSKINAEVSAKSLGTIKYISKHLNNAPPLKYKEDEIVGLLEYTSSKKYKAIDYILYNKTINKLDKWSSVLLLFQRKSNKLRVLQIFMSFFFKKKHKLCR
jgi:hypothetical protein